MIGVAVALVVGMFVLVVRPGRVAEPAPLASPADASSTARPAPTAGRTVVADLGYSIVLRDGWRRSELLSARTGNALQPGHDLYTARTIADETANAGGETGGPSWFWALLVEVQRNRDRLALRQWVDEGHAGFVVGQRIEDATVAGRAGLNVVGGTRGEVNYLVARDDVVYSLSYRTQGPAPVGATKADLDAMIASVQVLESAGLPSASPPPAASASVSTVPGIESYPLGALTGSWTFVSRLVFGPTATLELWAVEIFGDRRLLALRYEEPRVITQTTIRRQLSPDGRRIVLSTPTQPLSAAGQRLTLVDLTTGATTSLTDGSQRDTWPAWSPDGATIAFVRAGLAADDRKLLLISTDGALLSGPLQSPAVAVYGWSADSKYVAYASDVTVTSLLKVDTRTQIVLGSRLTGGYSDVAIDFRPPTPAFPSELVGAFVTAAEATIDIAAADGTKRQTIVRRPRPPFVGGMFLDPRWRPGSITFLYRLNYQIFTSAIQPPVRVPLPGRILRAEWAYDGNSIVYIVDGPANLEHGAEVRIALADGGNDRTLFVAPPAGDVSDIEDLGVVTYR